MRPFPLLRISNENPGAGAQKWRIRDIVDQGGGNLGTAHIMFLANPGDAAQPGPGLAFGPANTAGGSGSPTTAFAGTAEYAATFNSDGSTYLEFDFNLTWDIKELYYQARAGFPTQAPRHMVVEKFYGGSWVTAAELFGIPFWSGSQIRRFAIAGYTDDVGANAHRYWRLTPLTTFAGTGGSCAEIEIELLDATDTNVAPFFDKWLGSASGGQTNGFDGVKTGDAYFLFDSGSPSPFGNMTVDFFKKRDLRKVRLTSRSTNLTQSIKSGRVDYSDDGTTWFEYMTFIDTGSTPASNTTRTFVKQVPVNTLAPSISGVITTYGNTLTLSLGTWINAPSSYSVQWRKDGVAIAGETGLTYDTVIGDLNHDIDATVIAHNEIGDSATATAASVHIGVPGSTAFDWTDPNVLTAHRYWRLLWGTVQSGTLATIAELYFRDLTNTLITGTWTAWNSANGAASNLADGSGASFWGDSGSSSGLDRWVKLDLGAGNSAIVNKVEMTPRTGFQSQTPIDFYLQYSDDNATWTNATRFQRCDFWGSGVRKIFEVRPYIVQFYFDDGASINTVSELEVLNGSGTDLTTPTPANDNDRGRPFGTSDGNGPYNAFNDVLGSDYTGNGGTPGFTEWRFSGIPDCFGVSARSRSSFGSQAPHSFKVRCSRDGITYNLVYQVPAQAAWGSNERRSWTF